MFDKNAMTFVLIDIFDFIFSPMTTVIIYFCSFRDSKFHSTIEREREKKSKHPFYKLDF